MIAIILTLIGIIGILAVATGLLASRADPAVLRLMYIPIPKHQFIRLVLHNGTAVDIPANILAPDFTAVEVVKTINQAIKGRLEGEMAGTASIALTGDVSGQIWMQLEHIAVILIIEKYVPTQGKHRA